MKKAREEGQGNEMSEVGERQSREDTETGGEISGRASKDSTRSTELFWQNFVHTETANAPSSLADKDSSQSSGSSGRASEDLEQAGGSSKQVTPRSLC